MNCRPGDLARVIDDPAARVVGIVDRIFKLTVLCGTTDYGNSPAWAYEGPMIESPFGTRFEGISDEILRPIRDPGDDAKDEMLRPLPHEVTA